MAQFRCYQCGDYYDAMWGNTCNGCRKANQQHSELVELRKKEIELLEKLLKNGINKQV